MAISTVFVFICLAVLVGSSKALGGEAVTRKPLLSSFSDAAGGFLKPLRISSQKEKLKNDILELAEQTKRGLIETPKQKEEMLRMFEKLEMLNPTKAPLSSNKISGKWLLKYTTSASILGRGGAERTGEIVQVLDTVGLKASNAETLNLGLFKLPRKVKAELTPITSSLCAVQFTQFSFGAGDIIKVRAPKSFKGTLDVTYVDDEFRLSRGDKGNIFVLVKESDDTTT